MIREGLEQAKNFARPFVDIDCFRAADSSIVIDNNSVNLDKYLRDYASRLMEPSGGVARLVPNHDQPGKEILDWRWLSITLPPDLLIAAADINGSSSRVQVLDPTLRILEPVAHIHVHATATVPFTALWSAIGSTIDLSNVKSAPSVFKDKDRDKNIKEWGSWLRRAFVGRYVLDIWMKEGYKAAEVFLHCRPQLNNAIQDLLAGKIHSVSSILEADIEGTMRHIGYLRRSTERYSASLKRQCEPDEIDSYEISFIRRCLRYMASPNSENTDVFRLIWVQMTRIRVWLYRHLVHDPDLTGLDDFQDHFLHLDEYQNDQIENFALGSVCHEPGLHIERVELRKAPGGYSKLRKLREQSAKSKSNNDCEISWILHFIRDGKGSGKTLKELVRQHFGTAWQLAAVIRLDPELLKSIRGLDVASRELSGPLLAVTGALDHVREESRRIAGLHRGLKPLGLTVHVGEDFKHLLTGLRAVHEPFWWGLMRRGDRLGHALALGLDPEEWRAKHTEVTLPRCVRILDLAWVIDFIESRPNCGISSHDMLRMRGELQDHVSGWVADADESDFIKVARVLGKPGFWREIDGPLFNIPSNNEDPFWRLVRCFFSEYDECLRSEGKPDLIQVTTTDEEVGVMVKVQDELARLLAHLRTPIEVNPSSNLFVGGLDHPVSQPLFHLDPFDREERRGMVITLSADDPASFATTLADEYAYAWAGLVFGAGEAPAYTHEWLERAARASRRAVF